MEEFFNVVVGIVAGIIIGLVLHSSAGHTFGDWMRERFHWFDKDEKKDE